MSGRPWLDQTEMTQTLEVEPDPVGCLMVSRVESRCKVPLVFRVILFLMLTQSDYKCRAHIELGFVLLGLGIHVTLMKWGET